MSRHAGDPRPLVLVADDDPRVLELMRVALTQAHYRVLTALDGDEAVRQALAERPDAVVLETRLPRRSGLEVCEFLRHDPDDPHVPIVLLTALAETEARLDGLARGADEVMGKPFSPRELVARLHRLLVRASEVRTQRRRADELERELGRAQADSRRAHDGLAREHERRRVLEGFGRELQGLLDPDAVAERGLIAVQQRLDSRCVAGLQSAGITLPWRVTRTRGAALARFASVALPADGAAAAWLASHGRPVRIGERTRFRDIDTELAPLVALGCTLLLPLRGRDGLVGLVAADDPAHGGGWDAATLEAVESMAAQWAPALHAAQGYREQQAQALAWIAGAAAAGEPARRVRAEAEALTAAMLPHAHLPAREAALLQHAVALGAAAWSGATRHSLEALRQRDSTRFLAELGALIDDAGSLELGADPPERTRATLAAAVLVRYRLSREGGRSRHESWHSAMASVAGLIDPATAHALERSATLLQSVAA